MKIIEEILSEIDKYWIESYTRDWMKNLLQKHLTETSENRVENCCPVYECECWIRKKVSWIVEHADWEWEFTP